MGLFFQRAADTQELVWPNLQQCLQIHSLAASDRERNLVQLIPDIGNMDVWFVSDSILSFNKNTAGLSQYQARKKKARKF